MVPRAQSCDECSLEVAFQSDSPLLLRAVWFPQFHAVEVVFFFNNDRRQMFKEIFVIAHCGAVALRRFSSDYDEQY